jgi:predicted MPP superfamily phosphohydrolase
LRIIVVVPHPINMATTEQQPIEEVRVPRAQLRISGFVATVQVILFLAHWFVYEACVFFWPGLDSRQIAILRVSALVLSVSFVAASILAFRYWNAFVRGFYRAAAIWLGFLNFFLLAAFLAWIVYVASLMLRIPITRPEIASVTFGIAALAGVYGVANAQWTRVKRIAVRLPNLPSTWRGRVAAVVSDVHLGHVNGARFLRRIVGTLQRLRPDVVFLPGDLYDGTNVDVDAVVAPLRHLAPPFGTYFVTGNHEEFSDRTKYLEAVSRTGVRVLNNEKVNLEGLQVLGVHDWESADPERFRTILKSAGLDRQRASVLLAHVPRRLGMPDEAGVSLQISGHTHGGQVPPFTWLTHRIFGAYTYGLNKFGKLLVYTSYGAGTWGPPLRVGTRPEIVLIEFI